jgi:membrane protease subunit HflK
MTNSSKVLIDQKGGSGNLLYLPLDKLMQMTTAAPPEPPKVPEAPAVQESTTSRSRDAFRSRDRESR